MAVMLGVNEVVAKPGATVLASGPDGHPLLVSGTHGARRTLAWTTDIGPHWLLDPALAQVRAAVAQPARLARGVAPSRSR